MINQITNRFTLTRSQKEYIDSVPINDRAAAWDQNTKIVSEIKKSIKEQLDDIQNQKCCYCGLRLWETSRGEIEHIAPKAGRKKAYPEFAFTTENLALACEYCNGSSKKGEVDTILRHDVNYSDVLFKIVHPYFDKPSVHYEWLNSSTQITVRHKTWKGKYSIILFGLEKLATARAKQIMWEKKTTRVNSINELRTRFLKVITFIRIKNK